jgi:PmbA protein
VSLNLDAGLNVNVRMDEVETVEHTRDRGVAISVYFGKRKGSASTADVRAGIDRHHDRTGLRDRPLHRGRPLFSGLADAERMATFFPGPRPVASVGAGRGPRDRARHRRRGRRVARSIRACTTPTAPASRPAAASRSTRTRMASSAAKSATRHSLSCSLLGEDDNGMQRDYWYTTGVAAEDLESAEAVGRRAGERTLARLSPRKIPTQECAVLVRAGSGAFAGRASRRRRQRRRPVSQGLVPARFSVGQTLFPTWFNILEQPHIKRGAGSSAFDAEGVATIDRELVRDGVLARYILGSYSARKLGLASTGNAGGIHNLVLSANGGGFADMLKQLGTGFLVTELMGQGVNTVTGDYSRGAAGFWVENGVIAFPVDEVTIAGNLREMFKRIVAVGSDIDTRGSIRCGSILLEKMMVAGS